MTSPTTAMFEITGNGTHPLAGGMPPDFGPGSFSVTAKGDLACVGGQGVAVTNGTFHVEFQNGMTDDGAVGPLLGCTSAEGCGQQQSTKGNGTFFDRGQRFNFDFQATSGPEGESAFGTIFLQNQTSGETFSGPVDCLEVNGEFAVLGATDVTGRVVLAVEDNSFPNTPTDPDLIGKFDVPGCEGFEVFADRPVIGEIHVRDDAP
jgi:hypothetical protein